MNMEMFKLYLWNLKENDLSQFPKNLAFFLCALILLFIAKLARDITTQGIDDDAEITQKDNQAFGIYTAGYYAAVGLSFVGVFLGEGRGFVSSLIELFQYGITGIVCLGVSYVLTDRVYLKQVKLMESLVAGNSATALVAAGRFGFSGLCLLSAIHGEGAWFHSFVYFILGEIGCYIGFLIYLKVTPYDDIKAVQEGNRAVGMVCAGFLLSLGLLALNAMWGDFLGYDVLLVNFIIWYFGGIVLLMMVRTLGARILFPKSSLLQEIYKDRNLGAGVIMSVAYLVMSTVIVLNF